MRTWLWVAGGIVTGAAAIALAYEAVTRKKPKRVALIGDSLAVGLGPYLQQLAGSTPFRYEGHVGANTSQWAASSTWGSWLGDFAPTEVFVSLGANDIGYYPSPPAGPYQTIRDRLSALGARVIWLDVPLTCCAASPCRLDGVRQVVHSLGVDVVPATNTIAVGGADPKTGFAHPTPAGYAEWAKIGWSYT